MRIFYDKYNQPIAPRVYLGTPNNKIICAIDGIDPNSFDLKPNLTGTYSLSFDVNKYLKFQTPCTTKAGIEYYKTTSLRSYSYDLVGILMRVYVENVGWFTMQAPEEHDDGDKTYKTINAISAEIELQQHDLKNFKINLGTTDSYEMLADGNVEKIGDVEFAKEQITFYNKKNKQLSLLDLALKASGATGWSIGYIDVKPETYKTYKDGEYVETKTLLCDEVGAFDIDSQNLYTFLVQDVAKYFNCICVFDIRNLKINFYHPDNLGKDTGINISFRNLKQSHDVSVDEDSIFTRYYVNGDEELGISYVNFGSNYIEDLHYFMNEKYMSASLIKKYKLWLADVESNRLKYITATKNYNKQMSVITELYNRQPIDDCSTDWSTFSDEDLIEAKANYEAQQKGYEQFYVDENGNFNEEALKNSVDANDYYQIRDVIIPSIKIEFENRKLPTNADKKDYIDTYETDWKFYGLDELQVKLNKYKDIIKTCKAGGYDVPYSINSSKTKEVHEKMYAKYLDALNQLDGSYVGGCQEAYNQRKAEIDAASAIRDEYDRTRNEVMKVVDKETWNHNGIKFAVDDLSELSKLYIDGDYTNENMFLTSSDDQVSAIDEQLKLLKAAQDDLYTMSQPQYTYTTSLDNFISQYQYKNYTNNLNLGDYIHLEVDDDYVVKLRVISFDYNPLRMDEKLTIEFSSMIQSRNKRSDLSFLLDNASGGSKNSASGNSNNFLNNEGITLTSGLIQKLLSSGAFSNKIGQIINNNYAGILGGGGSISLEELNVKMMNVVDIKGQNAFFEYISSKLIEADKVVADSGEFKELKAFAATIKNAIIGSSSTETGIVINLTAENATISEALIKSLISQYITVGDLKAGNIITDNIKVMSQDGKLQIVGNTFTIYDDNNKPVIQLGQDKNGNYGLVISDKNGAVLLDSTGLHEGIVPDNFIKTQMICNGQVTEDKIDKTNIREWKDADGNNVFDVSKLYYGNDKFEVSYSSMKESVEAANGSIEDLKGTVANLGNGYTVVLSNESQNIPCTSSGITASTFKIEIPFKGYKGIKQSPCSVEISNLPQGITLASNKPSTDTEDGLVVLNVQQGSSLGGESILTGNVVFTCTVGGITIVKKFIWTKSLAGQQGSKGVPGENATTYYTWIKYADDDKGTNMSKDPVGKKYIGIAYNKESQAESNNPSDYTWSLFRGADGVKGDKGETGESLFTWIKYSNDATGKNMSDNPDGKKYIGIAYNKTTSTESTNPSDYTWSLIQGADGQDAVFYYLNTSTDVIKKETLVSQNIVDEAGNKILCETNERICAMDYDDILSPSTITFKSYKIIGNESPVSYACRFIIQESVNGVSYATKYTSSKDEVSAVYTPTTNDLHSIKCILCAAGSTTTQLDSQTVSILTDSSAIAPTIKALHQQFKEVDFTVDQMNKEIKAKATQKDIIDSINEYDGTTTQKVRDQLTEQITKIGEISSKVSDVETEITKKADGTTVTELTTKVSQMKQDADGFKQTVEKDFAKTNDVGKAIKSSVEQSAKSIKTEVAQTYGTKDDVSRVEQKVDNVTTEVQNARGEKTSLSVRIDGIETNVKDANGNITKLRADIDGVSSEVSNAKGDKATLKERVDSIDASVITTEKEISQLKIDKDKISTTVNKHGERISNVEQTANGLTSTVQNLKVGSENLVRNSNNLIFDIYNFVALLSDEALNRIIDENGNNLIAYY